MRSFHKTALNVGITRNVGGGGEGSMAAECHGTKTAVRHALPTLGPVFPRHHPDFFTNGVFIDPL